MKKCILSKIILLSVTVAIETSCTKNDDISPIDPVLKQINLDNPKTDVISKHISYLVSENDSTVLTYDTDGNITKSVLYFRSNNVYSPDVESVFKYTNGLFTAKYNYYYDSNTKTLERIDSIIYDVKNLPIQMMVFSDNYDPTDTLVISYNSIDKPLKSAWSSITYNEFEYSSDGNVSSIIKVDGAQSIYTFLYDTKINPFKGNYMYFDNPEYYYSSHNLIKSTCLAESNIFIYEYDTDGYPTKITTTSTSSSNLSVLKIFYK